jgi:NAD(P)-dependent dehydrogenase (short-subunit alcohol dehydrogenase family)
MSLPGSLIFIATGRFVHATSDQVHGYPIVSRVHSKEGVMPDLDGRVAVVTGGAGAIGKATCVCLSEQGAKVVVADLRAADAERVADELEGDAIGVEHDVRDSAGGVALAARTKEVFGRVDILVNNAGVNSPTRAVTDTSDEEWDRVMDINVRGTFVTTRAFLPAMVEQGRGRIIILSSIVGQLGTPFILPYTASKAALIGMTHGLAAEYATNGITVNSVHPGLLEEGMHDYDDWAAREGMTVPEAKEHFRNLVPQKEYQTPFLASDRARHITGAAFNVDGGIRMH